VFVLGSVRPCPPIDRAVDEFYELVEYELTWYRLTCLPEA
jgi:hypothetical protein